jgi:hypothetical protein
MGIIDKCTYTLSCELCGISEEKSVLDKGSGWSGSFWNSPPKFASFSTEWNGNGGPEEPELVSAKCATCGNPAEVQSKYSV